MDMPQFIEWFENHSAMFPDWKDRVDLIEDGERTISSWMRSFDGVSLDSSLKASQELLDGSLRKPFTMAEHISIVRARAKEIDSANRPRFVNTVAPERFICRTCLDSGVVSIMHPESAKERFPTPASVFCSCATGDRIGNSDDESAQKSGRKKIATFDPNQHVIWNDDVENMLEQFGAMKHPNHESSFDDWNAEGRKQQESLYD